MTGLKRTGAKDSFYDSEEPDTGRMLEEESTIERIARTDDWFEQAGALLRAAIAPVVTQAAPAPILVRTFGGLSITRGDATVEVKGKARALLVEVLARGGRDVCAREVAHAMWPHGETEFAMGALNTTLFRARRRYDLEGLLLLEDGRLGLNTELCLVDRWLLESALDSAATILELGDGSDPRGLRDALRVIAATYRGPLLEQDRSEAVDAARDRVRARIALVCKQADEMCRDLETTALGWLERIAARDPCPWMSAA